MYTYYGSFNKLHIFSYFNLYYSMTDSMSVRTSGEDGPLPKLQEGLGGCCCCEWMKRSSSHQTLWSRDCLEKNVTWIVEHKLVSYSLIGQIIVNTTNNLSHRYRKRKDVTLRHWCIIFFWMQTLARAKNSLGFSWMLPPSWLAVAGHFNCLRRHNFAPCWMHNFIFEVSKDLHL